MPAAPRRLPPAITDIISAAEWYDDQQSGLGDDFVAEVDAVIKSRPANPYVNEALTGNPNTCVYQLIDKLRVQCQRLARSEEDGPA